MTQSIIGRLKTLLMRKRGSFRGKLRSCLMRIKREKGNGLEEDEEFEIDEEEFNV
jgi:hypothetical protein